MKKIFLVLISVFMLISLSGCTKEKEVSNDEFDAHNNIATIVEEGPSTSSNPYDYIKASQDKYDELLNHPKESFEYSIEDLIKSNAGNGLKSYIEALLCTKINTNFEYDFESANDFLDNYKKFLNNKKSKLNDYDKYAKNLLNEE